jgi:tripartite-type tricarboxylate transporter receptor subunit TctC
LLVPKEAPMSSLTRSIAGLLVAALLSPITVVQSSAADEFPSHAVRIIVPYAAGGPSDTGARLVLDNLSRELGKPVFIENRGGGGGLNGTESFLAGELDGHSILLGGIAPLTIIPWTRKVSYVSERDFVPIGTVWRSAQTLVVRPSLGVKTMAEFIAYAKANPGKLTIGSAGIGTVSHLGSELLQREAGIKLIHVPFRSTSESMPQLIGGQIDGLFGDAATVAPQVRAGTVIALGVAAPQRSSALPDTPTTGESGYPTVQAEGWHGLVVSSKTPLDHVKRLREALHAAQSDPAYQDKLTKLGTTAGEFGPEALAKLIHDDAAKWGAIVNAARIQMD